MLEQNEPSEGSCITRHAEKAKSGVVIGLVFPGTDVVPLLRKLKLSATNYSLYAKIFIRRIKIVESLPVASRLAYCR